jgi:hypothetical protein
LRQHGLRLNRASRSKLHLKIEHHIDALKPGPDAPSRGRQLRWLGALEAFLAARAFEGPLASLRALSIDRMGSNTWEPN